MKKDKAKTKEQLIQEVSELRLRVGELEKYQSECGRMQEELTHLAGVQSLILNNRIMGIAFVRHRIFEWVNPRLADLLGAPLEEVRGASVRRIYASDEEYEEYGVKMYSVLARGVGFEFEHAVRRPDGHTFTGRIIGKAIDPAFAHEGSIWILEDITGRKRIEESLRESEEKYRTVVESASEGIAIIQDHNLVYVNTKIEDIVGIPACNLIGKPINEFIHPEDRDVALGNYNRRIAGEYLPDAYEIRMTAGKREIIWAYVSVKRISWKGRPATLNLFTDITKRKQAETALRESEAKYRLLVDNTYDLIWTLDARGRFTYASPSWNRTVGRMPSYVIGKSFRRFVHLDDIDLCTQALSETIRTKTEMDGLVYRVMHSDGAWHWHEASGTPVYGEDGCLLSFVGVSRDISDRKQAEEELKESQSTLSSIIEFLPDAAVVIDRNGKIIAWNLAMEKMTGISKKRVLGRQNCANSAYFYGESRKYLLDLIDVNDPGVESQYRYLKRKGNTLYAEAFAPALYGGKGGHIFAAIAPLYDNYGNRSGVIELIRDVTDFRRAEEDLREAHKRLDEIIENLPDATLVIDTGGKVIAWNRAMEQMTGIGAQDMLGKGDYEYAFPFYGERRPILIDLVLKPQKEFEAKYVSTERRGMVLDGEAYMFAHKGAEAYMSGRASALKDSRGNVVGAIESIRDITERRRLEFQLRQAQKMEAIGTLAGGIAHDFNNILASMIGFTEMAAKESRPDVRHRYHDRVLQACTRAKNLINQILSFSRKQEQELSPLDVKLILKEALILLRATLPSTIEIRHHISREKTHVLADPTQIHQIIINLCTNAAHAMRDKGGILDIRLSDVDIQHPELIPHPDLPVGSYVVLSVSDTGHGIDPAAKDKIFDPFFTTKNAGDGTGLGLSVVYGIVKRCGGAIDVVSEVGQGTTFTIYLPRVGLESGHDDARREEMDFRGTERILFVDDEEALVALARAYFESRGFQVTATVSSREAVRLFREDPERFDLVITDMTMPEMTGAELARLLLAVRPHLPVILCTGYSDSINMAQVRKLNIREFILKPVSLEDLGRLVRRVLDG